MTTNLLSLQRRRTTKQSWDKRPKRKQSPHLFIGQKAKAAWSTKFLRWSGTKISMLFRLIIETTTKPKV